MMARFEENREKRRIMVNQKAGFSKEFMVVIDDDDDESKSQNNSVLDSTGDSKVEGMEIGEIKQENEEPTAMTVKKEEDLDFDNSGLSSNEAQNAIAQNTAPVTDQKAIAANTAPVVDQKSIVPNTGPVAEQKPIEPNKAPVPEQKPVEQVEESPNVQTLGDKKSDVQSPSLAANQVHQPYPVAMYASKEQSLPHPGRRPLTAEEIRIARWNITLEELQKRNLMLPAEYYQPQTYGHIPPDTSQQSANFAAPSSQQYADMSTQRSQQYGNTPTQRSQYASMSSDITKPQGTSTPKLPPISEFSKLKIKTTPKQSTPTTTAGKAKAPRMNLEEHAKVVGHDSSTPHPKATDVDDDGFTHLSKYQIVGNPQQKGNISPVKKEDDDLLDDEDEEDNNNNDFYVGGMDDDMEEDDTVEGFDPSSYTGGEFDDSLGNMSELMSMKNAGTSSRKLRSSEVSGKSLMQAPHAIKGANDDDIASSMKQKKDQKQGDSPKMMQVKQKKIDVKNPITQKKKKSSIASDGKSTSASDVKSMVKSDGKTKSTKKNDNTKSGM